MTLGKEPGHTRKGAAAPEFEADQVLPTLTAKAEQFIHEQAKAAKEGTPFFLYLPLNAPHTPIVPSQEWIGKSGISMYADFVMQTDATVGRILDALKAEQIDSDTMVIMTSDNGCSPQANFPELLAKGHNPSHVFRGTKADIFDGGHRIPFIISWPNRVKAGSKTEQLTCLNDLFATCADLLGDKLPANTAEDSISFLPVLVGRSEKSGREDLIHHSVNGSFAIRQGKWKLELCPDSGGWSEPKPRTPASKALPKVQLYDLSSDIGEKHNLQAENPETVSKLLTLIEKYVVDGRSTPGEIQPNTGIIDLHRFDGKAKGD